MPSGCDMDSLRRYQIKEAAHKWERMRIARFYFKFSDYFRDNLPDKRSHHDYFKILEDSKSKDKVKIRQTINMLVRKNFVDELRLNDEERKSFFFHCKKFELWLITAIREKRITRWPRIYVDDSKYREDDGLFNNSLTYELIPEEYFGNSTYSEIDYEDRTKTFFEEVKFKGRPRNKFDYKTGQIKLDFNGLNTTIQPFTTQTNDSMVFASGNLFYGPHFRADDDCSGFNVDQAAAVVLSGNEYKFILDTNDALDEFFESFGFDMNEVRQSKTSDSLIRHMSDKICNGSTLIDHFLYIIKSVILIIKLFGTSHVILSKRSLKMDSDPIPFDPRLVDRKAPEESTWFYRHRKIAERSLPNWLLTLLQEVSQELKVVLEIDMNLNPVILRSKNKRGIRFVATSTEILIPDFIVDFDTIHKTTDAIFVRNLIVPEDLCIA